MTVPPVGPRVDPRAIIDPAVTLGANVQIGAWSVVGEGAQIGDNSVLAPHVVVQAGSVIGANVQIGPFCVIGEHPMAPTRLAELVAGAPVVAIADGVEVPAHSRVTQSLDAFSAPAAPAGT